MSIGMQGLKQQNSLLTVEASKNLQGALIDKRQKRFTFLKRNKRLVRKDAQSFKDELSTFDVKC